MSDLAWFYYCETCKRYGWELKGIYRQQAQPTKCPDCRDRLDLKSAQTLANAILEHGYLDAIGRPAAPPQVPLNNPEAFSDR